jgi:hypothetical protein
MSTPSGLWGAGFDGERGKPKSCVVNTAFATGADRVGIVLEGGFDERGKFVHIPFEDIQRMSEYFRREINQGIP